MKSFAAATLLAIASAQFSDVTHPENTRVDLENSSKFIGRIGISQTFDEWVDEREIDGAFLNVDQNPCLYQFICADGVNKPFPFSDDEALYVNHNCPSSLVHKIRFDITLDTDTVLQYHNDDTVRRVDDSAEGSTLVKTWIDEKKPLAEGQTEYPLGNDDGFLFDGAEPTWRYGYHICLADAEDLESEFCKRTEVVAPELPPSFGEPIGENNCDLTLAQLQAASMSSDFTGSLDDYQFNCYTWPLEFGAVGQANIRLTYITGNFSGGKINSLDVSVHNGVDTIVKTVGTPDPEGTPETANFGQGMDFTVYYTTGADQTITGLETFGLEAVVYIGSNADLYDEFYIEDNSYGFRSLIWATRKSDGSLAAFAPQIYE